MQSSASINLVKKKANILDEILKWSLSVGRLLIILTEIVAFTTFIYRFSLDRTLIDLHTKIKGEQAIVESIKSREATYRNLQERIFSISEISKTGNKNVEILKDIVGKTPTGITFSSFSINENKLIISANISSISSLGTFVSFLKDLPFVSSVTITALNNNAGSSIEISLSVLLKK